MKRYSTLMTKAIKVPDKPLDRRCRGWFFLKKTSSGLHVPVLERRKPRLLLRLPGALLLRLADRQFCGLLFHDPPRLTRLEPKAVCLMLLYRGERVKITYE